MALHLIVRIYMLIMASGEAEDIFCSGVAIGEVHVPLSNFHYVPVNNLAELKKEKRHEKIKMST